MSVLVQTLHAHELRAFSLSRSRSVYIYIHVQSIEKTKRRTYSSIHPLSRWIHSKFFLSFPSLPFSFAHLLRLAGRWGRQEYTHRYIQEHADSPLREQILDEDDNGEGSFSIFSSIDIQTLISVMKMMWTHIHSLARSYPRSLFVVSIVWFDQ